MLLKTKNIDGGATMIIIDDKYKRVADFCFELCRLAKVPLHFSKFSNKIYSNFKHIFLLVYKQSRRFTYEDLFTDLANNKELKAYLGLNKLPHYTTLIKFAKRLPSSILDKLCIAFKYIIPRPKKVAIDATGITLDNASPHYCKRINLPVKKRPFLKSTFIVDIENHIILLPKFRKKARHDLIDGKPLVRKLAKHYDPEAFYADRGYDSDEFFEIVFEVLGAYPLIFQRNQDVPKYKRFGRYRKETFDVFDYGEYLNRNNVETVNSIFKKMFGHNIKSRHEKMQKVEAITRVIAYNIDRLVRMGRTVILIFIKITRISY